MKRLAVALSLLLTFVLSGCSALSFDASDIMSPPKATGDKAEIQKLIEHEATGSYTLQYPKNGDNRSSIVTYDFDNDEVDEAIAFYCDKDSKDVHALFVENEDNKYVVIDNIVLSDSYIDLIDFADINGDKTDEILIGYGTATSSQNTLNIYSYSDSVEKLDATCTYSSLICGDFNNDKSDDILLISLYSGDIAAHAKLMIYNDKGGLSELSSTELDYDITQLAAVTYGQISYGTYGAIIDGISAVGDYTTQVVFFDPYVPSLLNPLYSYSGYSDTRRSTAVCSLDANNDELIDIPICSLMSYDSSEDTSTVLRRIDWSNLDCDSFTLSTTMSCIICPNEGYMLTMPNKWGLNVTARYSEKERETTIYVCEYTDYSLELGEVLLKIKSYSDEDFERDSLGYIEITRTGSTVYAYSLGEADNYLSISGDEVNSLFSLVNQ